MCQEIGILEQRTPSWQCSLDRTYRKFEHPGGDPFSAPFSAGHVKCSRKGTHAHQILCSTRIQHSLSNDCIKKVIVVAEKGRCYLLCVKVDTWSGNFEEKQR